MLEGLPAFLGYFLSALSLGALFILLYERTTPYRELRHIARGNRAAAVAFTGALLGFTLPLVSAAAHSVSLLDFVAWGLISGGVQCLLAMSLRWIRVPGEQGEPAEGVYAHVSAGNAAVALLLAALHLSIGMMNAASMVI
ncbi:MAG: DUF350 domain-containing protein [Pseudomonadota bacterium]